MLTSYLQQIFSVGLFLLNFFSQAFELSLGFLELIYLLLEVNESSARIITFVKLPVRIVIVKTRLLCFVILYERARISI